MQWRWEVLAVWGLVVLGAAGCSEEVRRTQGCVNGEDYTGRTQPFHTIAIDARNDFHRATEQFETGRSDRWSPYAAYATWDECRLYFGYEGPALGAGRCAQDAACTLPHEGATPFKYLVLYLDTDPLGDEGSADPRDLIAHPLRLPFKADYLVEIRTAGHTAAADSGLVFHGNVQMYRRARKWAAGLIQHWEAMGDDALTLGLDSTASFMEVAIDRSALGDPCAIKVAAWLTDTRHQARYAFWPPPDSLASGDRLTLHYYGFELRPGRAPNASPNFDRTDYNDVGACAFGPEEEH